MRNVIEKFPSKEEIEKMSALEVASIVLQLFSPSCVIEGEAVLHVNEFISHAANKMAIAIADTVAV